MFDVQPTPFDVRFRLLGFPVRVHPMFWVIMALLGEGVFLARGPVYLALWMACGFVSILFHELGHALFIRRYGSPCEIVLIAFGGLAIYPYPPAERWKRIVISLAGPGAGFLLLGAVVGSEEAFGWADGSAPLRAAYLFLYLMNLWWNVLNLLPIWPLDGGKVVREVCGLARLRRPDVAAFTISMVTAGGLALYGLLSQFGNVPPWLADVMPFRPGLFMTLWLCMFAYESYQLREQAARQYGGWGGYEDDETPPWHRR